MKKQIIILLFIFLCTGCIKRSELDESSSSLLENENAKNISDTAIVSNEQIPFTTLRSYDKSYAFINDSDQYCLVVFDKPTGRFLSEFTNFKDETGEAIDLSDMDIKEIVMNYVVGWTLDNPVPQRLYPGNNIFGTKVIQAHSNYKIEYGNPKIDVPYLNYSGVSQLILSGYSISGVGKREIIDGETFILFYPYKNENNGNFPILLPYSEEIYNEYKNKSFININANLTLEVQPVVLKIDNLNFPESEDYYNLVVKFDYIYIDTYPTYQDIFMIVNTTGGIILNIEPME